MSELEHCALEEALVRPCAGKYASRADSESSQGYGPGTLESAEESAECTKSSTDVAEESWPITCLLLTPTRRLPVPVTTGKYLI